MEPLAVAGGEKRRPLFAPYHRGGRRIHIGIQARAVCRHTQPPLGCCPQYRSLMDVDDFRFCSRGSYAAVNRLDNSSCRVVTILNSITLLPQEGLEDIGSAVGGFGSNVGRVTGSMWGSVRR